MSDPLELRAAGDALYSLGCRNPYRAILTAASRGLDSNEIKRAYTIRSSGEALSDSDKTLLAEFDVIVNESTEAIDRLR